MRDTLANALQSLRTSARKPSCPIFNWQVGQQYRRKRTAKDIVLPAGKRRANRPADETPASMKMNFLVESVHGHSKGTGQAIYQLTTAEAEQLASRREYQDR